MIVALLILAAAVVLFVFLIADRSDSEATPEQVRAWELAMNDEKSLIGRVLLSVALPLNQSATLQRESSSAQYRALQRKLASADVFSRSVDVFVAVQAAALFVSGIVLAFAAYVMAESSVMFGGVLVVGAVALAMYPWNMVSKANSKRSGAVLDNLPDFAELLQMPIAAGLGIMPALAFTASKVPGPVSREVSILLDQIRVNPLEEVRAFQGAGERLGLPEARAFFQSLLQAHLQGDLVAENLARQASNLRMAAFQRRRAELKKLPIKLVLLIALHLLPLVFIVGLLPVVAALGSQ
jgi:Flp pilus assembly protein TadB